MNLLWKPLLLAILLSACAASPLPEPVAAAPVVSNPVAVAAPASPAVVAPLVELKRDYHAAAASELPKVLAPDVSADTVNKIHVADLEARSALGRLEGQGRHYTAETLEAARRAVRRLVLVLEGAP